MPYPTDTKTRRTAAAPGLALRGLGRAAASPLPPSPTCLKLLPCGVLRLASANVTQAPSQSSACHLPGPADVQGLSAPSCPSCIMERVDASLMPACSSCGLRGV
eukprot:768444-Hanusia_phi.AAC.6